MISRTVRKEIPFTSLGPVGRIQIVNTCCRFSTILVAAIILSSVRLSQAEDWPQWRGPHFNGSSAEKGLPSKWSKQEALWQAVLPGPSASTPIILGEQIFTSTPDM